LIALHDFGDPIGATKRAYETLAVDGTVLIVEPMAGESVENNLNPVGRVFSGAQRRRRSIGCSRRRRSSGRG